MQSLRVGFIGAGRMATALAGGFVKAGLIGPAQIIASDPVAKSAEAFAAACGGQVAASNNDAVGGSNVLFLAVKPQSMSAVMAELNPLLTPDHLVVSIAAGVTLKSLAGGLGPRARLVRVMPNTPCLVGRGASAFSLGPGATPDDSKLVARLLSAVGFAAETPEHLLDAVTGLSGSGPAFVYVVIEALSDGGVRMGLPRDLATALAAHTVLGAAEMVLATREHPAALKDQVASPGGTTIAGLQALEDRGVRAGMIAAVQAATLRSIELGRPAGS